MRKLVLLLLALAALAFSCTTPTDGRDGADGADGTDGAPGTPGVDATTPEPNVHVLNSAWEVVYETTLDSRAIDSTDFLQAMLDSYNAAHTDDQWRIIYGDVPPADSAPKADAVIIDSACASIYESYGIERSTLAAKREELRAAAEAKGGTLYIDKTPPSPLPVITDYERYAIYLVAADGSIIYEEHATAEAFAARVAIFTMQAQSDGGGEYVISGRLYP